MDVTKAIKERMTTRGFKPDPVPPELLRKIIEQALRAPSWANTQPWQFAVVTGQPLEEIKKGFVEREADERTPDIARPYDFPEPYISRIRNLSATDRTTEQDKDYRRRQTIRTMMPRWLSTSSSTGLFIISRRGLTRGHCMTAPRRYRTSCCWPPTTGCRPSPKRPPWYSPTSSERQCPYPIPSSLRWE